MQIVIGTAGHIDHGKTSLVKALTGADTDHLVEEKNRGMTIDLGFAYLNEEITIIDVPGHEKFIKNMVAGVSTIQIALIVIAADDGLMPQSYEHIDILQFLNVQYAIVALTKTDIAEESWIKMVEKDISSYLDKTNFKNANIVRTSTKTLEGIDKLNKEIISLSKNLIANKDRGFFYLPVDRVFSKKGHGTVVTGTVLSGSLAPGKEVEIIPGNNKALARSLQTHGNITSKVQMGDRAAINLSNIDKDKISRGTVLIEKNLIEPSSRIIAYIKMTENTKWKIKNKQSVHLHLGTSQVVAKVITYGLTLSSGQSGNVLFELNYPISAINDQRFIIRSLSPMETIAGCVVLDQNPRFSKKELKNFIKNIELDPAHRLNQLINIKWKNPLSLDQWSKIFNVKNTLIQKWSKNQNIIIDKNFLFNKIILEKSKRRALDTLAEFHSKNPYKKSILRDELINLLGFGKKWFEKIINELANEVSMVGAGYALSKNKVDLNETDIKIANQIESKLLDSKFNLLSSINFESLTSDKALQILYILKDKEKIIQIDSDLWIHRNCYNNLLMLLSSFFDKNKYLSISEFKSLTSTTRKNAIPLLEYCDKSDLTIRENNNRTKGEFLNA